MNPINPFPIRCEILAPNSAHAAVLAEVATTCARDLDQPLDVACLPHRGSSAAAPTEPTLTLHLPAELAATQDQVWCLACRLACFCPSARVSVLVLGAFAQKASLPASRQSA